MRDLSLLLGQTGQVHVRVPACECEQETAKMLSPVTIAVVAGIGSIVVSTSIVGGIIAHTINEGEHHKERMTKQSPPPPASLARRILMKDEVYGNGQKHFELTDDERKVFTRLALRERNNRKR